MTPAEQIAKTVAAIAEASAASRAEVWAKRGDALGLTSVYNREQDGDVVVYHGLADGFDRSGFLFVTRDRDGASAHGSVKAFHLLDGAKIYADLEGGTDRSGRMTLLEAPEGESSGIVHADDLEEW